jgi:outer membrane protein assembly factor BamA
MILRTLRRSSILLLLILLGCAVCLRAQSSESAASSPYGKTIREINIRGVRTVRETTVRSQLASKVGQTYTEKTASEDLRWLERLNVFSSVHESTALVEGKVILTIDVQEWPFLLPFPTLNITRENGASGGLGGTAPKLMHGAISLSGSFKVGGLTEADIGIRSPWYLQRKEFYAAKYNYRDRINKDYSYRENSDELNVAIGVGLRPDWKLSGKFGVMSMGSDKPGITLSPDNRDNIPALGAELEYDGRDSFSIPHRGWQAIFDVTQSGGFLGGLSDFVTTQFDVRRYQQLADRHILVLFSLTTLQSGIVGEDVPVYLGYKIGGTNTVRGWDSDARGGNNQFINTLEYRFEVLPPQAFRIYKFNLHLGAQLVAFADVGTAWSQGKDFTRNMIAGGGFGIHVLVPFVDTIRMDFGFGQSGTGIHPHIHIREKAQYSRNRIR